MYLLWKMKEMTGKVLHPSFDPWKRYLGKFCVSRLIDEIYNWESFLYLLWKVKEMNVKVLCPSFDRWKRYLEKFCVSHLKGEQDNWEGFGFLICQMKEIFQKVFASILLSKIFLASILLQDERIIGRFQSGVETNYPEHLNNIESGILINNYNG